MASASFPDEVFVMILDYLPKKRIIGLIEISPTIDRIVFSSTRLKEKIVTKWDNFECRRSLASPENTKITRSQLVRRAKTLEEITFNLGFMDEAKFHAFLRKNNGSLKRLYMNGLAFKQTSNLRKFNMKCLEEIKIERMTKDDVKFILSLISAPKLRVFHYKENSSLHRREDIENDAQEIVDFIAPLAQLKSLTLPWYCTETLVNFSVDCFQFEFKLESLEIQSGWFFGENSEKFADNFKKFIKSQSDSLIELELRRFYLNEASLNQILQIKRLNKFCSRFCEIDFENLSKITNSSIESLFVSLQNGDFQTEASVCEIINCGRRIRKLLLFGQEMTQKISEILTSKNLLASEDSERQKFSQLVRIFNGDKPVIIKKETSINISDSFKGHSSLMKIHEIDCKTSDVAILAEKLSNIKKTPYSSSVSKDNPLVLVIRNCSYFTVEMMTAGLFQNKDVNAFKMLFLKNAVGKPAFLAYLKEDLCAIVDFFKTHHRAYGRHSLTWEAMRRTFDPLKRCRDCQRWNLSLYRCPFNMRCTINTYDKNQSFWTSRDANPWTTSKVLMNSVADTEDSFETNFPQFDKKIKQNMRLVLRSKVFLLPDGGFDDIMKDMVDFLRFARFV